MPDRAETIPDYSIVIPVRDEAENIAPLLEEIGQAMSGRYSFEAVLVDDASVDETAAMVRQARQRYDWVRGLRHAEACGQSAALLTGILNARAPMIVTIDGDGQNDPSDIPVLIEAMRGATASGQVGMVSGQRRLRHDPWLKKAASWAANTIRSALLRDRARDTGCGLKLFSRSSYLRLPYFDNIHRFLPALMQRDGHQVIFVDVSHRHRRRGRSKYGVFDRLRVGIVDLLGVAWLLRRRRLPQISEL